jgi:Mrp family chromosome partitioning ATPase
MGRTLEVLKHRKSSTPTLKIAQEPPIHSPPAILPLSSNQDEIPFIEVGGPNHAMHGSNVVMARRDRGQKTENQGSNPEEQKSLAPSLLDRLPSGLNDPPAIDFLSLSVAFHPLGSFHSIETATGLVASDVAVYHQPEGAASQEFRAVATGIQQQLAAGGTHVLFFTGLSARAGTTTTALNLAMTWAKHEKRKVLVVDASEARSALAAKMGLSNTPGLSDVLKGTVPLAQALQETKQANCWILAAGESSGDPNAAPQPKAMRDLLRQARKQFDLILLDALPWNEDSATISLASGADAVYLVLRQSETKTPKVDEVVRRLQRHDIFLGGCIITHRNKE